METVELLLNPACAHCVRLADELAEVAEREGLPVAAVDLARHPELAERLGWEHSPLVRVGDRVEPATGDPEALREMLRAAHGRH